MLIFVLIFVGKRIRQTLKTLYISRFFRFVLIILYSHSHVSLLIELGFSVLAIADRLGHEGIEITYRYAHLFPSKQVKMAEELDIEKLKMEGRYEVENQKEEKREEQSTKCIDIVSYVARRG